MVLFDTAAAPAVTGAIVGIGSAQQVSGITCAGDVNLSADDMLEIEQD